MRPILLLIGVLLLVSACETTAGLGRDIRKGGKNIEDAAERLKP